MRIVLACLGIALTASGCVGPTVVVMKNPATGELVLLPPPLARRRVPPTLLLHYDAAKHRRGGRWFQPDNSSTPSHSLSFFCRKPRGTLMFQLETQVFRA